MVLSLCVSVSDRSRCCVETDEWIRLFFDTEVSRDLPHTVL